MLAHTLSFLVAITYGVMVDAAGVYRGNNRVPGAQRPVLQPNILPQQPILTHSQPQPANANVNLEQDLENIQAAGNGVGNKQNSGKVTDDVTSMKAENPLYNIPGVPKEDDLDLQLLYDLIRAVEYEANAQLFDKVLSDLDNANYPIPAEAQHMRLPQSNGKVPSPVKTKDIGQSNYISQEVPNDNMDEMLQLKHAENVASGPAGTNHFGGDSKGRVIAHEMPGNVHVPLHKRLSAVLQDVPRSDSSAVFPKDGLADKRNMEKKAHP